MVAGGDVLLVGFGRAGAIAASLFADNFKVLGWDQASGALQRVASFVPGGVVFALDYVQEIALRKAEVAGVWRRIVVKGFDDLWWRRKLAGVKGGALRLAGGVWRLDG